MSTDRLTETSKRALLYARAAVSEYGGESIDSAHLLLGVLQAAPDAITLFAAADWPFERIQNRGVSLLPRPATVDEGVGIPFSADLKTDLERAAREASALGEADIRPEHLVLGLLDSSVRPVQDLLRDAGVQREHIVEFLKQGR